MEELRSILLDLLAFISTQNKEKKHWTNKVGSLPDKSISLVFEDPDLLNGSEAGERLLQQFLRQSIGDASAVDGAVGRGALVVHFIET